MTSPDMTKFEEFLPAVALKRMLLWSVSSE